MRTRLVVASAVLALGVLVPGAAPAEEPPPPPCGGSPTAQCLSVRVRYPVKVGRIERIIENRDIPATASISFTTLAGARQASVYFYWDEG